ncbi:MAG: EutN/CcmL family microcompartment protein [Deltaproteobacteria bacterium]|nr:EutN/CcmL family microcompartment protein [Deltaproteobacteria bacterium]
MLIGRVVGTVVATRKDEKLGGLRFLMIRQIGLDLQESDRIVVAADAVGAGLGEVVLFASGSSARQTVVTDQRPVDATIMAIVDSFDVRGEVRYRKLEDDLAGTCDPVA